MKNPAVFDAERRIGMLLKEKWTLSKVLGVGGMASVYSATHRNGSKVAVKILHAHLAKHPDALRRFLREGYVSNKVEHPDVVHVLDDDIAPDGSPFLVMELLDGRSLDAVLEERGALPLEEATTILTKLLGVLQAAHEKGIIHRDLKPANIFLLQSGGIKVLDFGIARLHEIAMPQNVTVSGAVLGTPAFMPPEQARGLLEEIDARSDVWAAGATLFMLLANRNVRSEATTTNEALMYAMAKPVAPMATLLPSLPRPIASVLDRALAFDKSERWPSAGAMREALAIALEAVARGDYDTMVNPPAVTSRDPSFLASRGPFGLDGAPARALPNAPPRSIAPLPLFTSPHPKPALSARPMPGPIAPQARSPLSTNPAVPGTSKATIVGLVAFAMVLAVFVGAAIALSRDDRPRARDAASSGSLTAKGDSSGSANDIVSVSSVATNLPSDTAETTAASANRSASADRPPATDPNTLPARATDSAQTPDVAKGGVRTKTSPTNAKTGPATSSPANTKGAPTTTKSRTPLDQGRF